jgi:hypothetical protein
VRNPYAADTSEWGGAFSAYWMLDSPPVVVSPASKVIPDSRRRTINSVVPFRSAIRRRFRVDKPSDNVLGDSLDLGISICLFLALVAVFWVYLLVAVMTAIYQAIVHRR